MAKRKRQPEKPDVHGVRRPPAGADYFTGEHLLAMGWQQAPIDALVHDGVSGGGSLVYHRSQILAVLDDPDLGPRVGVYRHSGFFRSHEARVRIVRIMEKVVAKARRAHSKKEVPARKKTPRANPGEQERRGLLLRSAVGEPGKQWISAAQLYAAHWSKAAVSALIPENISRPNSSNWHVLYHRAQIDAIRNTPNLKNRIGHEDAGFWHDRTIRGQVRALQHRSRHDAQDNADSVDTYMRSRRSSQAVQARTESPPTALRNPPTQPPTPARRPAAPQQMKKTPGVHGAYPPDLGPDPRTRGAAGAAAPPARNNSEKAGLPGPPGEPTTLAERARRYRQLVETAEQQLAKHRGQRRRGSDRPIRIAAARNAVLWRSQGQCENPRCPQPDMGDLNDHGGALLDVDHIGGLAATGDDEAVHMIALCPNCHRIKTLGQTRHQLIPLLREAARRRHSVLFSHSA